MPILGCDSAHDVFGERRNRETRVDAGIGGHNRPIHDIQTRIVEYLGVQVHYAVFRIATHRAAAQDVRGGGNIEQTFQECALRDRIDLAGKRAHYLVTDIHLRLDRSFFIAAGDQPAAEQRAEVAAQPEQDIPALLRARLEPLANRLRSLIAVPGQ